MATKTPLNFEGKGEPEECRPHIPRLGALYFVQEGGPMLLVVKRGDSPTLANFSTHQLLPVLHDGEGHVACGTVVEQEVGSSIQAASYHNSCPKMCQLACYPLPTYL